MNWLFASSAERRLLGIAPLSGPTPWLVGIMTFTIVLIAAAGLAMASTAGRFAASIEARYSVEVVSEGADSSRVVTALRRSPDVINVSTVSETEMRATLARWLGAMADSPDLPVPALVNFDLRPGASLSRIAEQVKQVSPGATIASHQAAVAPILHSLRLLQWVALALVLLLASAAAGAVVLAARADFDTHKSIIDILHGVGATDQQVTDLFQRKIAIDAAAGSLVGGGIAAFILALLAAGSAFLGQLTGGATLTAGDIALLALLPIALTILATIIGRTAVRHSLRQDP